MKTAVAKSLASCCAPSASAPMSADDAATLAAKFKALGDPVRVRLLSLIASHDGGEACVCDLQDAFELSQPTISHHLKVLYDAGLLDRRKRGTWAFYRLQQGALAELAATLTEPSPAR